jgi:hypothetical protein
MGTVRHKGVCFHPHYTHAQYTNKSRSDYGCNILGPLVIIIIVIVVVISIIIIVISFIIIIIIISSSSSKSL